MTRPQPSETPAHLPVALSIAIVVLAAGCGGERVILNDGGEACLSPDGSWPTGPQDFEAETPIQVTIRFHTCLSSTCDVDRSAECDVEVSGDQIFIDGRASYTDNRGPGTSCTTDCGHLEAQCTIEALPRGTYTVRYGTESLDLTLPGAAGVYCLEQRD